MSHHSRRRRIHDNNDDREQVYGTRLRHRSERCSLALPATEIHSLQRSAGNQAVCQLIRQDAGRPAVIQREDHDNAGDAAAEGADVVNATGNILGPLVEKGLAQVRLAEKTAAAADAVASSRRAKALKKFRKALKAAAKAADRANWATTAKDGAQSAKALRKAEKSARKARKAFSKALRALGEYADANAKALRAADEAAALRKSVPKLIKALDRLPMNQIGFVAAAVSKALTTTNTTLAGKAADSAGSASVDAAFSAAAPIVALVDALIGLAGGERYTISGTLSDSVSSTTGLGEAVVTGDVSGISKFHEASKRGENTKVMELVAESGEFWSEQGGTEERVQTTGDFYGGAETLTGRVGAAIASVPGVGHAGEAAGEAAGWAAWQTYDKGGKALAATADAIEQAHDFVMPKGRSLNPMVGVRSLLRGENPFW